MSKDRSSSSSKQISYQIGYRKGSIRLNEQGEVISATSRLLQFMLRIGQSLELYLWRSTPHYSKFWWSGLFYVSPIVMLLLTILLIWGLIDSIL